jgi:hypothetical protein
MSRWSGKCDLSDFISGLGGWYDKDGNPVKFGQEGVGAYYSDEFQDFREFKKRTGGVMYQHVKVKVTEYNQKKLAEKSNGEFEVIEHTEQVPDKRKPGETKEKVTYTYKYWGKEYKSLKELNKKGIYTVKEIHFDTLLDLLPYYPYIVAASCFDQDHEKVFISSRSFVEEEEEDFIQFSGESGSMADYYRKALADHYREIVLEYYNPTGRDVTATLPVKSIEGKLFVETGIPVDSAYQIEVYREGKNAKASWIYSSPKVLSDEDADKGLIFVGDVWPNLLKEGDNITLTYIRQDAKKLYLF